MPRGHSPEPRPRAILVCIHERRHPRPSRPAHPRPALESWGATLLRRWEAAGLPVVFVERDLALAGPAEEPRAPRPRAGDVALRSEGPSLLRDPAFLRFFEDNGGPLLILLGDELGEFALQTAIDGFLDGHPIIVVKDGAPSAVDDPEALAAARDAALPLLSCFARLMSACDLTREWVGCG